MHADTVVLDVDGTLVDSNYHHTLAWWSAFREHDLLVHAWRIHRAIGMGGDRLVASVAGDEVEQRVGDDVRAAWERRYDELLPEVRPFAGAAELLDELRDRGHRGSLASSGIPRHTRHAVDLLGARERAGNATTSEDAEASKPDPELVQVALDEVDADRAVMVGDSVWDVRAGAAAGVPVVGLLCGGFGAAELEDAGAVLVCDDIEDLLARIPDLLVPPR